MPIVKQRQYRAMQILAPTEEKKLDSNYYVEGYAANYERYVLYEFGDGPIYEQFRREDFTNTDMSDVIMQYDHSGRVLARQSNNTLKVQVDDTGLFIAADLSKTDAARSLYTDISERMVTRMSWCFFPESVDYDPEQRLITYNGIRKIYDVSAVSIPANDTTSISARSMAEEQMNRIREIIRLNTKKRLELKIKLALRFCS